MLGGDIVNCIMKKGILLGQPLAQETTLGWIISGNTKQISSEVGFANNVVCLTSNLEREVEKFWNIEEISDRKMENWSQEEIEAESFYKETVMRNKKGRYVVRLPFKKERIPLGRSRNIAVANFLQLERKFKRNPQYKALYVNAMEQYYKNGHTM